MDRILIADSSESMRHMLRAVLEAEGFQVAEAADCVEAVQLLTRDRYELLLTDLRLPKCETTDVLRAVKELNPFCRVIMMATYGDIEGAVQAVRQGAHDFLTKSIDPDRLLRAVRRALEGRPRASMGGRPVPP
jgi:two-component system response regulator PilR (NtrC family)